MEYIEVSARTVDDAITEALIKLGATSDAHSKPSRVL